MVSAKEEKKKTPDFNQPPVIERLFIKLAAIYGHAWRNNYKTDAFLTFAKNEWLEALANYEEKIIYQAVCICRKQQKFPPNLPEFIDYCNQLIKKNELFKDEVIKKADPKIAAFYMKKIKDILQIHSR